MERFFLSYSRADQEFALRLATDLRAADCPVWVDQFDILPSQKWDRTVEAAVRECTGLLLILSPRSVASENVLDEVSVALDSGKRIIPVLFEKCVLPLRLARVQFIDATGDYSVALDRTKAAVLGLSSVRIPSAAPKTPDAGTAAEWHPEVISRAAQRLASHVGPIASVLVQKASKQAGNEAELYAQLATSIPHPPERERFLQHVGKGKQGAEEVVAPAAPRPAPASVEFDPGFIDRVAAVLTVHLGPLARHIAMREQKEAADRDDLFQRLGARIPKDRERAELLRKLRAL